MAAGLLAGCGAKEEPAVVEANPVPLAQKPRKPHPQTAGAPQNAQQGKPAHHEGLPDEADVPGHLSRETGCQGSASCDQEVAVMGRSLAS